MTLDKALECFGEETHEALKKGWEAIEGLLTGKGYIYKLCVVGVPEQELFGETETNVVPYTVRAEDLVPVIEVTCPGVDITTLSFLLRKAYTQIPKNIRGTVGFCAVNNDLLDQTETETEEE